MYKNNRNICISCGKELPKQKLFILENMPASAQNIPTKEQLENENGITLNLCQCTNCGLVQFDCEPVDYYKDVIRAGGYSTTMVELRKKQYKYLIDKYNLSGKKIWEIGCGQGEFLSVLDEFDVEAYGIEYSDDLVKKAQERGLKVWKDFAYEAEAKLKNPYGVDKYDCFLSFNFLEHQPDPKGMLECIYRNLIDEGIGLITVPSLEYILDQNVYYELIRDHLAYYTFETLETLLNISGFIVLEKSMINRDTLSVIVKKADKDISFSVNKEVLKVDVSGLVENLAELNKEVSEMINEMKQCKKRLAIWGASHQGFTLAATTELKDFASYIIDSAPFKQGKYAPASHLPIVAPSYYFENPVDRILIVAPGYTDEIANTIKTKYGSETEIFVLKSKSIEKYNV